MKEDDEMGRTITEMAKDAAQEADEGSEAITLAADTDATASARQDDDGDPLERGMAHLRSLDLDPLRIWSIKGPKGIGGLVMAVFLQATSEVVMLHQMPSGRYVVFRKGEL